jgi:hypothetical protein
MAAPGASAAGPYAPGVSIETGGGFFLPLDESDRNTFGVAPILNVGVTANLTGNATWLILDTGILRQSGREFRGDGTFDLPSSTYWAFPVTVGVRVNAARDGEARPARVYLGLAFRTIFLSYRAPFEERRTDATIGVLLEFRPEFRLSDRTDLFVRQRFGIGTEAGFNNQAPAIDSNGISLDVGVSWRLKPGYLASRGDS